SRLLSKGLISRSFGRVDRHGFLLQPPVRCVGSGCTSFVAGWGLAGTGRNARPGPTGRMAGKLGTRNLRAGLAVPGRAAGKIRAARWLATRRRTPSDEADGEPLPEAVEVGRGEVVSRRLPAQIDLGSRAAQQLRQRLDPRQRGVRIARAGGD